MPEAIPASRLIPAPLRRRLGINAALSPSVAAKSLACVAMMKARGIDCGLVRCAGHLPILYTTGEIHIGAEFGLDSRVSAIEIGATEGGTLRIGDRVAIASGTSLVASLSIEIGDDVMIGDRAGIFDNDFHAVDATMPKRVAPVRIHDRAWIARNALVMPGVEVGANSVVAAGAIVTKDVPENTLVAGMPARVVRELTIPPGWRRSRID
jgi:maltose O-acetyltransferase